MRRELPSCCHTLNFTHKFSVYLIDEYDWAIEKSDLWVSFVFRFVPQENWIICA